MSFEPNAYNTDDFSSTPEQKGSKAMAITSMVLGIVAVITCICYCSAIPLAIVSIILAIIVLVTKKNGKPFAITGIITSGVAIIVSVITIVLYRPMIQGMQELVTNSDEIIADYKEDGEIPDFVLEMFNNDEEVAKQFMDGFVQGYGE